MTLHHGKDAACGKPRPSVLATAPPAFLHHLDSRLFFRMPSGKQKILKSQSVYEMILNHLKPAHVVPDLIDAGILDEDESTRVMENATTFPLNSNSLLIYLLLKKDVSAFTAFIDSLRNNPTDFYRGLLNCIEETERRRRASAPVSSFSAGSGNNVNGSGSSGSVINLAHGRPMTPQMRNSAAAGFGQPACEFSPSQN